MSILINGVDIPNNGDYVKVGNNDIDKVVCNGIVVWEKQKDLDMIVSRPDGWNFHIAKKDNICEFRQEYIYSFGGGVGNFDNYYYGSIDLTGYNKIKVIGNATGDTAINGSAKGLVSIQILQEGSIILRSTGVGAESGCDWRDGEPEYDWDRKLIQTTSPYSTNGQDAIITEQVVERGNKLISFDMNVDISSISGNCEVRLYFAHYGSNSDGGHGNSSLTVNTFQFLSV